MAANVITADYQEHPTTIERLQYRVSRPSLPVSD